MKLLHTWCNDNDLILNLSKGKTEAMIFCSCKSISKHPSLTVSYNYNQVSVTMQYKYLRVEIDSSLNMNSNFDKCYKKACSRLNLLNKTRSLLTKDAATKIYQSMVEPTLTYCSIASLKLAQNRIDRLSSIHRRACKVTNNTDLKRIESIIKRRACIMVRKSMDRTLCEEFNDYFKVLNNNSRTRNGKYMLALPKINMEYARSMFAFMGASMYNDLPLDIRKEEDFNAFCRTVRTMF